MSKFGHRVIGREAATKQQVIQQKRADKFGPRVIGNVLAAQERIREQQKDSISDPAVAKAKRLAKAEAAKAAAEAREKARMEQEKEEELLPTTSVKEVEAALENNPAFYEQLFAAEKQRADGPRKGALRLFLAFEQQNEDREERKQEIADLLGE